MQLALGVAVVLGVLVGTGRRLEHVTVMTILCNGFYFMEQYQRNLVRSNDAARRTREACEHYDESAKEGFSTKTREKEGTHKGLNLANN